MSPAGTRTIVSWNVAGLRGLLGRRPQALADLARQSQADILCLQETRLQDKHVESISEQLGLEGWQGRWSCSQARLGHAGVATLWRTAPRRSSEGLKSLGPLASGRVVTTWFDDFCLVNTYVPNSGEGLKNLLFRTQQWDPSLARHLRRQGPQVILAGDLNVAPEPQDVYDPVRLAKVRAAGFTTEERDSFAAHLLKQGLVDVFRAHHPRQQAYTFFSYRAQMRAKNRGWRLDHFLASGQMMARASDCHILHETLGSDHLPIVVRLLPRQKSVC